MPATIMLLPAHVLGLHPNDNEPALHAKMTTPLLGYRRSFLLRSLLRLRLDDLPAETAKIQAGVGALQQTVHPRMALV
jgi:hypothetical protein